VGHIGPEALHGGPIGRVRDDDLIEIVIDRGTLTGSVNLVGAGGAGARRARVRHAARATSPAPRACAARGAARGHAAVGGPTAGQWRDVAGCVYDVDRIVATLEAGLQSTKAVK